MVNRSAVHDLALDARKLLVTETWEQLEAIFGILEDGSTRTVDSMPALATLPDRLETRRRIEHHLADEQAAGVKREQALKGLVKETSFTHLNRLVAFKMLEARRLIKGAVDKGQDSNAFKIWLADPENAGELELYGRGSNPKDLAGEGPRDIAYRRFLIWQSGQMAREIKVLFDPDNLPSRLFPRPHALSRLLDMVNAPDLAGSWQPGSEETIGWIYQFFNEEEKREVFDKLLKRKQKITAEDIPAATELFTPRWIVKFLTQNALGRHWLAMHPDSRLAPPSAPSSVGAALVAAHDSDVGAALVAAHDLATETTLPTQEPETRNQKPETSLLLDYLVPLPNPPPPISPKLARDITVIDPACGSMQFGLVAFDLLHEMYKEEIDRAGEPGWPAQPSVGSVGEIPAAIIANNLFGIDLDLRAVQLSALTLYIKAKALNPATEIRDHNLVCASVTPLDGGRIDQLIAGQQFTNPMYERAVKAFWKRLELAPLAGSLLRLEDELKAIVEAERESMRPGGQIRLPTAEVHELWGIANDDDFAWGVVEDQIVRTFDDFVRQEAALGRDQSFFGGEASKSFRLLDLMRRRYDVVLTNPPYLGRRGMCKPLADFVAAQYPRSKGDLYAAFIERCSELLQADGRMGMITQQSFMFISSYEDMRKELLENRAIETICHVGPRAFAEISGEKVNTVLFQLRGSAGLKAASDGFGTYFRLVRIPDAEGKRIAFENALAALREAGEHPDVYHYHQADFDAIPGSPWVYWITPGLRELFVALPKLGDIAPPRQGLSTGDNHRFLRFWWEVGAGRVALDVGDPAQAKRSGKRWFPYVKGGDASIRWWGNRDEVVNWERNGAEIKACRPASVVRNERLYFRPGVTWGRISQKALVARALPSGFIFGDTAPTAFPDEQRLLDGVLGLLNSEPCAGLLAVTSPTVKFEVGQLAALPLPSGLDSSIGKLACQAVDHARKTESRLITSYAFVQPQALDATAIGSEDMLNAIQSGLDEGVYRSYGISGADRAAIEVELNVPPDEDREQPSATDYENVGRSAAAALPSQAWVDYAVGVALGRFHPGVEGAIGRGCFPADVNEGLAALRSHHGIIDMSAVAPGNLEASLETALGLMIGDAVASRAVDEATAARPLRSTWRATSSSSTSSSIASVQSTGCCSRPRNRTACTSFTSGPRRTHFPLFEAMSIWAARST